MKKPKLKKGVQSENANGLTDRVKDLLDLTNFTYEELGKKIGLSGKQVSRIRKGETQKTNSKVMDEIRKLESSYESNQTINTAIPNFLTPQLNYREYQLMTKKLRSLANIYPLLSKKLQNDLLKRARDGAHKKDSQLSEIDELLEM